MYIYTITNQINNKQYVGLTTEKKPEVRFRGHLYETKRGSKNRIHNAIRKYGIDNFSFKVIDQASSIDELHEKEVFWISELNTMNEGYNILIGGGSSIGWKHTDESKRKLSESLKGRPKSPEHIQNMCIAQKGKTFSDETRKKMSEARKGKAPWNKGIKIKVE